MSWDIYGETLTAGHCEVHPHIAEPWPCGICLANDARTQQPHCPTCTCGGGH